MQRNILNLAILMATVSVACGQSSITYFDGPAFQVPALNFSRAFDINQDGATDFHFSGGSPICTTDIPVSACVWPFSMDGNGTNQILGSIFFGAPATIQLFGEWIGSNAPPPALWSDPRNGVPLATYFLSQVQPSNWGLSRLGTVGVGYLGVRFYAADGLHYGWIRVRLPRSDATLNNSAFEFAPVVMEWAYETRPETPIRAGDTGLDSVSEKFAVVFPDFDCTPAGFNADFNIGRIEIRGDTLRYEFRVVGSYQSADLRGPSAPHSRAKPIADLAHPRIDVRFFCPRYVDPNTIEARVMPASVFVGEVKLSNGQIQQLKRGACYVSIGGGAIIGRVVPAGR
ncbi:MAG: hypothetical protein HY301_18995 [Verrucomicrobia bacterium]|nr:hypothetical protein [Verrucomicrobiota bacterium]